MSADLKLGTVDYLDWMGGWPNVKVMAGKYANDDTAIVLICDDGEPLVTASTNLEVYHLRPTSPHRFFIRSDMERKGLADILRRKGVLTEYVREVRFGPFDTTAQEVELAPDWRPPGVS